MKLFNSFFKSFQHGSTKQIFEAILDYDDFQTSYIWIKNLLLSDMDLNSDCLD